MIMCFAGRANNGNAFDLIFTLPFPDTSVTHTLYDAREATIVARSLVSQRYLLNSSRFRVLRFKSTRANGRTNEACVSSPETAAAPRVGEEEDF